SEQKPVAEKPVPSSSGRLTLYLMDLMLKSPFRPELAVADGHLERSRKSMDRWGEIMPPLRGVTVAAGTIAGLYCETHTPKGAHSNQVLLYFHGGGFCLGSPRSHRNLASRLALEAGIRTVVPDYSKSPEHLFPHALEDTVRLYRHFLDQGIKPHNIVFAGDSAGGNLVLTTLLKLKQEGLPLPAAGCPISPWCDVTLESDSMRDNASKDQILTPLLLQQFRDRYVNEEHWRNPLVSPVQADFAGLPPLLIQVGSREVLLDDARRVAQSAAKAGVPVELEVWDGMQHVWHYSAFMLKDGKLALRRIGQFLRDNIGKH
ncbi:MAG TPA: alpha/beta hydrolase, partial [Dongiaceae bacterium]|nr:alpha/beta hydrolase [Dongiaceae bacterium]